MARSSAAIRVCYFNRSYWPDTGATGQLLTELAEDLVRLHGMEERLHDRVVGQDEAIAAVSDAVRRARAGLKDPRRPIGSFLFMSRYSLWRCSAGVRSTYSTTRTTSRISDAIQSGSNRSGKLILLNATQKYSQGSSFNVHLARREIKRGWSMP